MAIKIEHGGQSSLAAGQIIGSGLAAAAQRQQQDKQLAAKMLEQIAGRTRKVGGTAKGGGTSKGSANDQMNRLAFKAEVEGREKEQKFSSDMALKQEAARLDSNQWKYEYTTKQQQEMAQLERSNQLVQQSEQWSPAEKATFNKAYEYKKAGFNPTLKAVDPNEIQYEEGRGPQNTWINPETGATEALDRSNNVRVVTQFKDTKDYLEHKAEADRTNALADNEIKAKAKRAEDSIKLFAEIRRGKMPAGNKDNPYLERPITFDEAVTQHREVMAYAAIQEQQEQPLALEVEAEMEAAISRLRPGETYTAPDGTEYRKKFPPNPFAAGRLDE